MAYEALRTVVGRKRPLEILSIVAEDEPLNFTDIEARVETSSDVVSESLEILTRYGLVERTEKSRQDVQYSTTKKGKTVLESANDLESLLVSNQS